MRIHYLQHVDFESPVHIHDWAEKRGHDFVGHHVYRCDPLPALDEFDMLVVMGGPMGVHDEDKHAFLKEEKQFIRDATQNGKRVLGICLGHQLIADALGGTVGQSPEPETGFGDVFFPENVSDSKVFGFLAGKTVKTFQLHGDAVLTLPPGAKMTATNAACPNQAFELHDGKTVGLQFHLELTGARLEDVFKCVPHDFQKKGKYVDSVEKVRGDVPKFTSDAHRVLERLLDNVVALA